ncbi:MAG: ceramidase domain-containing protein [Flavobacteriales bacterium]|nr:ceramidase domain-containing protein [Flavobacteriales bacterium]
MSYFLKRYGLWLSALMMIGGLALLGPVYQDNVYHSFARDLPVWNIPHGWNVLSNLPFILIGIVGLRKAFLGTMTFPVIERCMMGIGMAGILLTGFGSSYYHLAPSNHTLLWDRLPMTLVFTSLFCLVVTDYLNRRTGAILYLLLLPLGIGSVLYWYFGEAAGGGDLRPYIFVQFFPMVIIPVLLWTGHGHPTQTRQLAWMIGWYVIAKLFETGDAFIGEMTGVGGHTFKHLTAACATWCILRYIQYRKPNLTS